MQNKRIEDVDCYRKNQGDGVTKKCIDGRWIYDHREWSSKRQLNALSFSTTTYRTNILARLVSETPDHRLRSCFHVFFGNCSNGVPGDESWGSFSSPMTTFSFEGERTVLTWPTSRMYLVSGTQKKIVRKFIPVKIADIHFCHRQDKFETMKPQIRGPKVFPPAIAFLVHIRDFFEIIQRQKERAYMYIPILAPRSCKKYRS